MLSFPNVYAAPFLPSLASPSSTKTDVKDTVVQKVMDWGFSPNIVKYATEIINEWYSGNTLNGVLSQWERQIVPRIGQLIPLRPPPPTLKCQFWSDFLFF